MGKIIGISGKAGAGKDYLADLFIRENPGWIKKSFGDELKKMAAIVGGFRLEDAYTQTGKQKIIPWLGITIREFLQKFGTDCMRKGMDEDFWIKKLFSNISDGMDVVIPDMRFMNEIESIDKRGGLTIRVERFIRFSEWSYLTGIGPTPLIQNKNDLINKDSFKSILIEKMFSLSDRQKKILSSFNHESETDLDFTNHNVHINNRGDMDMHLEDLTKML